MSVGKQADYKMLFESLPILCAIFCVPELEFVAATDLYMKFIKRSPEEVMGKRVFDVFPNDKNFNNLHAEKTFKQSIKKVLEDKTSNVQGVVRYDIEDPNNDEMVENWARLSHKPILDKKGEVVYIIQIAEDINSMLDTLEEAQTLINTATN